VLRPTPMDDAGRPRRLAQELPPGPEPNAVDIFFFLLKCLAPNPGYYGIQ